MSAEKGFTKDTGYAWVILFCAFVIRIIECVVLTTMGIYILEFLEYFHMGRTLPVTLIVSCHSLAMALSGPPGGYLMKVFGVRPVLTVGTVLIVTMFLVAGTFPSLPVLGISYAIIGLGSEQLGTGASVMVQQYFDKRRSLASGVMMSGLSCGTFIWPPLIRFLIDTYTWRGSFYILAGISAQGFVFISLLRPPPTAKQTICETDEKVNSKDLNSDVGTMKPEMSKSKKLMYFIWVLYTVCFTLQCTGHFVPMNFFPLKGRDENIDKTKVPLVLSMVGGLGIFVRPIAGYISDRYITRITLATGALFICGAILCVTILANTFPPLMAIGVILGIVQSLYIATIGAQWVDVFGLKNIELGTGLGGFAVGFSIAILNPVGGALIDLTGNTDIIFIVFGGVQIISGIMLLIVRQLLRHHKTTSSIVSEKDVPICIDTEHGDAFTVK